MAPTATAGPDVEDLGAALRDFVSEQLPEAHDVAIDGLRRLDQGYSRENWPFDLTWTTGDLTHREALILRRDPVASVLETSRRTEHELLVRLEPTPLPAPRPRWVDETGAWFGRPSIVLERHPGTCDWFVLEGGTLGYDASTRLDVAHQLCDLLASVHTLDWEAFHLDEVLPPPGPGGAALGQLDHWTTVLEHQALEPHPELADAASWLRHHLPPTGPVSLVHADFKPGNTLIVDATVAVLLDWELAHLGDAHEDLAWVTNPVRRREHLIPGAWEVDDLLGRWEQRTSRRVDPVALHWWQVLANYKLAVIGLTGVRSYVAGRADRVFTDGRNLQRILLGMIDAAP